MTEYTTIVIKKKMLPIFNLVERVHKKHNPLMTETYYSRHKILFLLVEFWFKGLEEYSEFKRLMENE